MKKKVVFLTGAGMSAESGVSTFRDNGGLWEKYNVQDVCTHEAWERNPGMLLDFYNMLRRRLLHCAPNEGHRLIAELEKDFDVEIITQNVDNLHEQAGSTQVLHLHGELMKCRSVDNEEQLYDINPDSPDIRLGDRDAQGAQLRPHIVFFGEAVPNLGLATHIMRQADIIVVVGTSLNVYPAAGLLAFVPKQAPIFCIDPKTVNNPYGQAIHHIMKGASEGMKDLIHLLETYK